LSAQFWPFWRVNKVVWQSKDLDALSDILTGMTWLLSENWLDIHGLNVGIIT
jgi:hypothetical protein